MRDDWTTYVYVESEVGLSSTPLNATLKKECVWKCGLFYTEQRHPLLLLFPNKYMKYPCPDDVLSPRILWSQAAAHDRLAFHRQPWHLFSTRVVLCCLRHWLQQLSGAFSCGTLKISFCLSTKEHLGKRLWLKMRSLCKLPFSCKKPPTFANYKHLQKFICVDFLELKGHFVLDAATA